MNISPKTKLCAIMGNPVTHSLSPCIHNAIYEKERIDAVLLAFGNPSIQDLIASMRTLPIHMAAVTMPHKQTIMPLLDHVDPAALAIGAVNTVINREGVLSGYNTDLAGIVECFKGIPLKGKKALLIGAGGVAQPIAYYLAQEGAEMYCLSRTLDEAKKLCAKFGGTPIEMTALKDIAFDVIANATPVGMAPDTDATPIDASLIHAGAVVFDVIYAPLETKLMREAKARGARVLSGLTMFIAQAIEQERLWLGRDVANNGYDELILKTLANR